MVGSCFAIQTKIIQRDNLYHHLGLGKYSVEGLSTDIFIN